MSLILTTSTNPGIASWSSASTAWQIVATDVVTFGALSPGENTLEVTVPAGLEGSPVLLGWVGDILPYNVSGGRLSGSITGTTLTIRTYNPGPGGGSGLKVSYAVLQLTV